MHSRTTLGTGKAGVGAIQWGLWADPPATAPLLFSSSCVVASIEGAGWSEQPPILQVQALVVGRGRGRGRSRNRRSAAATLQAARCFFVSMVGGGVGPSYLLCYINWHPVKLQLITAPLLGSGLTFLKSSRVVWNGLFAPDPSNCCSGRQQRLFRLAWIQPSLSLTAPRSTDDVWAYQVTVRLLPCDQICEGIYGWLAR